MTCADTLGWINTTDARDGTEHIVPVEDTEKHLFKGCWCKPFTDGAVIIHNSADHREDYFDFYPKRKVN